MSDDVGLMIPQSVADKIRASVNAPDAASMNGFVIDALNTYLELGNIVASGKMLYMSQDELETPGVRRVLLPSEQNQS